MVRTTGNWSAKWCRRCTGRRVRVWCKELVKSLKPFLNSFLPLKQCREKGGTGTGWEKTSLPLIQWETSFKFCPKSGPCSAFPCTLLLHTRCILNLFQIWISCEWDVNGQTPEVSLDCRQTWAQRWGKVRSNSPTSNSRRQTLENHMALRLCVAHIVQLLDIFLPLRAEGHSLLSELCHVRAALWPSAPRHNLNCNLIGALRLLSQVLFCAALSKLYIKWSIPLKSI